MKTSMSDTAAYREICRRAAADPEVFAYFKRHPDYTAILEHVTQEQGWRYLNLIVARGDRDMLDHGKDNDVQGGPFIHNYPGFGVFSPTTLRYVYMASDLMWTFGSLAGMKIVEIGGGYGGQAKIICDAFDVASYEIFDLPEAQDLQRRYLSDLKETVSFPPALSDAKPWDLAISNYAFSECERGVQQRYLDLVRITDRGYFTMNFDGQDVGYPRLNADEIVGSRPGSLRLPHEPDICPGCYLWVWGQQEKGHGCPATKTS